MISPTVLGLPAKFKSWRIEQYKVFEAGIECDKYAFLADAPTGIGKSLIGAAFQKTANQNFVYLVNTKQLQDQILADFPYARTLKGRSNYPCLRFPTKFPSISANECTDSSAFRCEQKIDCPYRKAKEAALSAPLAVLNYSYFLYECNFANDNGDMGRFSNHGPIIADEVDAIEDELMGFISLVITKKQLDMLAIDPPTHKTKFEAWLEWSNSAVMQLKIIVDNLEQETARSNGWRTSDMMLMKKLTSYRRLLGKLSYFSKEVNNTWVWYPSDEQWEFKPVWVSKYSQGTFWKHVPMMYGMSATILDPRQLDKNIGISNPNYDRSYDYIQMSSPFKKENRPIYYRPVASISNKTIDEDLPKVLAEVDRILDDHAKDKVLIHTVSYKIRDYIINRSKHYQRMMTHATIDRATKLETFKNSSKPLVLVSPSMDRGVDLPGDQCRAVIIVKVPFPYLGDPQIQKRLYGSKDGNSWYAHKTVSTIIQMSGRGCRAEDDYCTTYILDEQFGKLIVEHGSLFPSWFKQAIIQ